MPIVDEPGADVLQAPLDAGQLAQRWKEMLADPALARVAAKVELDAWGRIIVMSPVDPLRGNVAGRLCMLLIQQLGGRALVEVGVLASAGVLAPDVVWCSEPFWRAPGRNAVAVRAGDLRRDLLPLEQPRGAARKSARVPGCGG